jgi:thiol-disulfide isomerase/thioredoxin
MNKMKVVSMAFSIIAILIAIASLNRNRSIASGTGQIEQAVPAPSWQLQDLNGKTVHSSDFKGKVVILDFWATWCPPCRAEIPGLVALQKQYGNQGLAVIGASVDEGGADMVGEAAQKLGINYPIVLADDNVQRAFGGITAIPATFIIDREGRIVKSHLGLVDKDEFENEIKPLLNL